MKTLKPITIIGISVICSVVIILGILFVIDSYDNIKQNEVIAKDLPSQEQYEISQDMDQHEKEKTDQDSEYLFQINSVSMSPVFNEFDIVRIDKSVPFEDIDVNDIIAFYSPIEHDKLIIHRVETILDERNESKTVRTKGDANQISIPGTDYPITKNEYVGKVVGKLN